MQRSILAAALAACGSDSENQLVAMARQYFLKYDRMAGNPTPS